MKNIIKIMNLLVLPIICFILHELNLNTDWIGVVIGIMITSGLVHIWLDRPNGVIQIDRSNPNKDTYRLVLDDDLPNLANKRYVTLKVDMDAKLTNDSRQ